MHPALWVSKTGLSAMDKQLSVISNNLANVSTTGFKKDRAVFEDLLYHTVQQPGGLQSQNTQLPSGLQMGAGVRVSATQKDFSEGDYNVTDRDLDVAIQGQGFFQILMPDGNMGYTRDGQFQLNSEGDLVTSSGFLVEPQVTIPQDAMSVTIGDDGTVSIVRQGASESEGVGQLSLAGFINPEGLSSIGQNLFVETSASGAPIIDVPGTSALGNVRQNMVETSNVNSVEELVSLITAQRGYEMNSKVVSAADGMMSFVIQQL
ncbi:Flagella basal body rod protein [Marinomonas sp. MED121]|uniref:flagellar basal-body rod protein FlgG n=1 Tax=Marinomonas sp. MED121 TaxID=314277 RepID=UPI0000690435|nr:flagellar basal-body rod protein FlgG [Marinomonas sp. MED121]EAQ66418.1 Flagella basal body rod protein [Marinomonas sp. MED121]